MMRYKSKLSEKSTGIYDIFLSPVVTEKSTAMTADSTYVFCVSSQATKHDIKCAAEKIFNVDVLSVNTVLQKGKTKRFRGIKGVRSDVKKAMITIKKGQNIDFSAEVK